MTDEMKKIELKSRLKLGGNRNDLINLTSYNPLIDHIEENTFSEEEWATVYFKDGDKVSYTIK